MQYRTLTKNAKQTAFGTLLSRILGYIRDMLVANFFGAGVFADAFYAAFRIPNLFRRIFGEGAFSAAFIPVFTEYIHTKGKSETQNFLNVVFSALVLVLVIASVLGIFFSPFLVKAIAWGFANNPEKMQLTVELTKLMFPFICFICLAAFLSAVLNVLHSFFLSAFAPSALSISEIFYMLSVAPFLIEQNQIKGLAVSVIFGGFLHLLVQYPKLRFFGFHLKFKFNFNHPALKKVFFLMVPSVLGLSVDQINSFIDTICGSFLESGSITSLYYSNRIMQLPLAIFGIALASVSLPTLSESYVQKDISSFKKSLNFSIRLSLFALLPSMLGLSAIGFEAVRLLFERGHFDISNSIMTSTALFYYSLGLPAYSASKIFANAFYAFQDTKTPVKMAAWSMIAHVFLCVVLMRPLGVGGLAFATSIASYLNTFLLIFYLNKKIGSFGFKQIWYCVGKTFISSTLGAIAAFFAVKLCSNLLINVPIAILSAIVVFFLLSKLLKSEELEAFLSTLKTSK
ncbi:MAG: murein biosynthesis integral membrane protein MurJ [Elusimicrobiota bacterium]|jgi:putative peptidoglycan lipid II flippase|nr:murein biosynthesis integral membrane protein MurJ [Elusimicrobiota bacterium]